MRGTAHRPGWRCLLATGAASVSARCAYRSADPSRAGHTRALRARRAGRADPPRCQKARAHPSRRRLAATGRGYRPHTRRGHGFDYVHAAIDDHSRLAYAEIHPDETGARCAEFLGRAAAYFAECGITRIERVMTDNAFAYRHSHAFADVLERLGARHVLIRPHCPWQNGKVERLNRTLQQSGPTPRSSPRTHAREALPEWLTYYNTRRRHSALGGRAPITRRPVSRTGPARRAARARGGGRPSASPRGRAGCAR